MLSITRDDRVKNILNHINAGVLYCQNDEHSTILYANDYFYTMIGYTVEEVETLFQNRFADMVIDDVSLILVEIAKRIANEEDLDFEFRMRRKDGSIIWIHDTAKYDQVNDCWYVTIMDISEMKSIEYERERLEFFLNQMPNKIVISDIDGKIIYKNKKASDCVYYDQDATHLEHLLGNRILGREYNSLLRESLKGRMVKYETRFKKDGVFIGHDKNYLVPINDRNKNVFNFMQVSEDLLANSDVLTHFPTRFMFEDYFRYYTKVNGKSPVYICIVDIDNFKAINDTYGHVTGDKAIQLTAQRLTQILGREDYICRFGGDEFIVLFVNQTKEEVMTKCHKIIDLTKEQVCLEGYNINLTYSIGVASSQGERVYEKILKRADKALYEVKARGKSHILFFNELCSIR